MTLQILDQVDGKVIGGTVPKKCRRCHGAKSPAVRVLVVVHSYAAIATESPETAEVVAGRAIIDQLAERPANAAVDEASGMSEAGVV